LWNWHTKQCLQMIQLEFAIISLSFHPTGRVLAIANGTRLHFLSLTSTNFETTNIATTTTTTTTWILNRGRTATHATLCPFPAQRQYCHCQGCQSQHGRFGKRSCPST
jgi:hypothetical protein